MMRRRFAVYALLLTVGLGVGVPPALAQADPVAFVNELGRQAIQVMGPSASAAQRLQRFRQLLATDFDIPGIGRFVLGRYWRIATPAQQQEFLGLLQEYVAQAYSARLAEYAGEPFRAISSRQEDDQTVVLSQITRSDGSKVKVDWYLVNHGAGYKVADAYVAGVSMKVTQRDEFASVIQQGGGQVEYLLSRLRQKIGAG
jgi:phospholipid transport system substrate-binding protein